MSGSGRLRARTTTTTTTHAFGGGLLALLPTSQGGSAAGRRLAQQQPGRTACGILAAQAFCAAADQGAGLASMHLHAAGAWQERHLCCLECRWGHSHIRIS